MNTNIYLTKLTYRPTNAHCTKQSTNVYALLADVIAKPTQPPANTVDGRQRKDGGPEVLVYHYKPKVTVSFLSE